MNNNRIVVAAALIGLAAPIYAQKAHITGVEQKTTDSVRQIWVQGTDVSRPKIIWAKNHTTYIMEFSARLDGKKTTIPVEADGIRDVQCLWYTARPARVRVVLHLDKDVEPQLSYVDGNWLVSVPTASRDTIARIATPIKPAGQAIETSVPVTAPKWSLETALKRIKQDREAAPADAVARVATPVHTSNILGNETTVVNNAARLQQQVSLDFVGTDVVQILKALAIQTSENIIVSPDVSPSDKPVKLTVSLNRVSLDDALSFVTAMSGLRYARVGSTYIVTPSHNFSEAMRMVVDRTGNKYETRVVNLMSGAASQIREAAVKAIPPEGKGGYYEIILPGAGDLPLMPMTAQAGDQKTGNPAPDQKAAPAPGQKAAAPTKAYYLMVVGDPQRVEEVEGYIHELDKQISSSSNLAKAEDMGSVVVHIQSGNTEQIKATVDKLVADDPRASDFSVTVATVDDNIPGVPGTKVLMLVGPKSQLNTLQTVATSLDKAMCEASGKSYVTEEGGMTKEDEIIDLTYVEPTLALAQVRQRFPMISAWTFTQPVTPSGASGGGSSSGGTAPLGGGTGGSTSGATTSASSTSMTGLAPMKLIVRGSRSTVEQVKAYVHMIDVAPRQVALELRVMELTKEDALKLGLDWNILDGTGARVFNLGQGQGTTAGNPGTVSGTFPYKDGYSHSVLGTLDQLGGSNRMLARPNALISDGRSTNLFVGDTVRYIKSIQASQNGTTVTTDELKVGVKFDINARIGANGAIALNLEQNFSLLTGFTPVPGGGQLPQTSDRTTDMFVNMKSGDTIAIGGLIQDQDRKSVSGIPFLKDLPLIGFLFSRTNNSRIRTEIVFFLTAVEVNESNRANAASPHTSLANSPDPMKEYFGDESKGKKKGGG